MTIQTIKSISTFDSPQTNHYPFEAKFNQFYACALSADGLAPSSAKASAITRQYQLNYENDKKYPG